MSDEIIAHVIHAFEHEGQGGNPAGVVLDADRLSAAEKQRVAAAVGLSETAFVSTSRTAAFKLEFFTPTRQIAHCGHATIATFSYLRQNGRAAEGRSSKETIDGNRDIVLEGDMAFMEQRAPQYWMPQEVAGQVDGGRVARSLALPEADLLATHPPIVCSTGNRFLLVGVRDAAALRNVAARMDEIASISEALNLIGYYAWTFASGPFHASTRMFAPLYGIAEEAGTGMAAGPLACYLHDRCGIKASTLSIQQGAFMTAPSPSRLEARLVIPGGGIERVFVGGRARYERSLRIPRAASRT